MYVTIMAEIIKSVAQDELSIPSHETPPKTASTFTCKGHGRHAETVIAIDNVLSIDDSDM